MAAAPNCNKYKQPAFLNCYLYFKTQHHENNKIPDTATRNERIIYPGFGSAGEQGN